MTLKRLRVTFRNLLLFARIICPRVPFWRWPQIWRQIQADHRAEVARRVLALRLAGKVRMDEEGRLYSNQD